MRVLYIADDGTQFDAEYQCRNYEYKKSLKHINNILSWDENKKLIPLFNQSYSLNDNFYQNCEYIMIKSKEALEELYEIADYCGWSEFEEIPSVGLWQYKRLPFNYEGKRLPWIIPWGKKS